MYFAFKKNFSYVICIIVCTFFVSFMGIIFKTYFLDDKFFADSSNILNNVLGDASALDTSYTFTVNFYKFFNFFNFTNINQWSFLISIVGSSLLLFAFRKYLFSNVASIVFYFTTIFLLNIYVFTISKDFIQFLIFLVVRLIISSKIKYIAKIFFIFLVFVFEALFFRSYYVLVGCIFLIFYIFSKLKMTNFSKSVLLVFSGIFALLLVKFVIPDAFSSLANVRYNVNESRIGSDDARTMILNIIAFDNENIFVFITNSIINLIRLIFPIELLFRGSITYVAFFFYQMFLEYFILKAFLLRKKFLPSKNLVLVVFVCYLLVLSLFEPDFGSFLRHELVCVPLLFNFLPKIEKHKIVYRKKKLDVKRLKSWL